jgi:4'-phosphopantetheinyl transferase
MSHPIYWTLADRARAGLQNPEAFLSPAERKKLATLRFPKRRDEWLLGRWGAKSLARSLPDFHEFPLAEVEIRNTPEGVPFISISHGTCPAHSLSISHSGEFAFCALTLGEGLAIGADLERVEPRTDEFVEDYFTPVERDLVNSCPPEAKGLVATLIWSAKESMLKALQVGLRWDTRQVEVSKIDRLGEKKDAQVSWQALHVRASKSGTGDWCAWWQCRGGFLLTLAAKGARLQSVDLMEQDVEENDPTNSFSKERG